VGELSLEGPEERLGRGVEAPIDVKWFYAADARIEVDPV